LFDLVIKLPVESSKSYLIIIMKKIFLVSVLCFIVVTIFAQKETFDIVTYTPPKGWKKEVIGGITSYSITNKTKNTWCQLGIVKSIDSKGNIEQDFDSEWQSLIVKNYKPRGTPHLDEVKDANGWKIRSGTTTFSFNKGDATALLTTISGFDRCVSIIATTNSEDYLKDIESFLSSVDLKKPEVNAQMPAKKTAEDTQKEPVKQTTQVNNSAISGVWSKTSSARVASGDAAGEGAGGYTKDQYTFNANGTYSFVSKTFRMNMNKIILVKENGIYIINGTTLTINPQNSITQSWSKSGGVDKWGSLLSSQSRTLEKASYTFTKYYFSGIDIWNLVLQSNKPTVREGAFSNNTTFNNAWYFSPISFNNPVIEMPGN
jgi:hypothetical protein